jgi:D-aminopeptidase
MTDAPVPRRRARAIGIAPGRLRTGRFNAITDVKGVRVGHTTLIEGDGELVPGQGPVRTGVTAILPNDGDVFEERVIGSGFVLNGAGEVAGFTQLQEWGLLETPILLTNTHSVGAVSEHTVRYMVEKNPGIGNVHDVLIPVVGECDDSWLNDIAGRHVAYEHTCQAIEGAASGPVAEGAVGGGTGMVTCDLKGGIGTSSRKLGPDDGGYTVGVLVMSNFGRLADLRVDGFPLGEHLSPSLASHEVRRTIDGSIIAVVATDAPLLTHQIGRLCKRAALGIGRCGSYAAHGSGEIVLGFSTANTVPRHPISRSSKAARLEAKVRFLVDTRLDALYQATIEATEEAILNALFMAEPMTGHSGHFAPALDLDVAKRLMTGWRQPAA